jgi:xyloglucan-specific endo-beta-1,4-glucanase
MNGEKMAQARSVSAYVLPLSEPLRLTEPQSQVSNEDTVFTATWEWKDNPDLVHAFPNIKLESDLLPIQLSNLSALNIAVTWSMTAEDGQDLAVVNAGADVVMDMFLDPDPVSANSTTLPKYEVMVWMGAYGGKKPIGFNSTLENLPTYSLNGTNLYASTSATAVY